MTKAHTDRGKDTERILARFLREHGFPGAERAVKTGLKTIDRVVADPGDITGTPGLVWQAKALKPITRAENGVPRWLAETEAQRREAGADLGVLVLRRDQRPAEHWFAFLPLVDLYGMRGLLLPDPLADLDRPTLIAWPARLYLADLVTLLRACGYGEPLGDPTMPATPGAVATGVGEASVPLDSRAVR